MDKRIVLCLDGQSLRNPTMIGLAGEDLEAFPWLACVTDAAAAREFCQKHTPLEEVWVVSCDDMEPVNVAAALKRDNPGRHVYLVACGQSGSLASRVTRAGIDGVWSESAFLKRYAQVKKHFSVSGRSLDIGRQDALHTEEKSDCEEEGLRNVSQGGRRDSSVCYSKGSGGENFVGESSTGVHVQNEKRREAYLRSDAQGTHKAHVIAVAAGSGGCGKSVVTAAFAAITAKAGLVTAVLDADLQFGDVNFLLGMHDALRIEEAIDEPYRMGKMREEMCAGQPAVLAAPRRLETAEVAVKELPRILDAMQADYDVVVINTGSFWSEVHALVLEAADSVVFLLDQRPSSLRATVHAVELCARLGIATGAFTYAVNRHRRESLLSAVDVSCALRGAHAVELPDGGRMVDELLGAGYPNELLETKSEFVESLRTMLIRLLPPEMAGALKGLEGSSKKRRSMFSREAKS